MDVFANSCIERATAPTMLGIDEAFDEFKQWVRDNKIPIKVPKKGFLQKYLDSVLGQGTTALGSYAYGGFRISTKCPPNSEVDEEL